MNTFFSLSIRTQILSLIVLMSLAPFGITIFSALQKHDFDKHNAWLTAERLCNEVANEQAAILSGTDQLLSSLAYVPSIQNRDARSVTALFAQLVKKNPEITNILIADMTGKIWASALPMRGTVMADDRRFFRNALATGNFSSGEFTIGRVLNKPALSFGYPIRDSSGKIRNVAIVAFTLGHYSQLLKNNKLPDRTSLVMTDHRGIILFDATQSEYIGKEDKGDVFKLMTDGQEKGVFQGIGITGKHRYFAYAKLRLRNEQTPYMYVRTGVLQENLSHDLLLHVGILGLFTLIGICLAGYISKRCISDKIIALKNAAQAVGNGNLLTHVSDSVTGGELGELALSFDGMAAEIVRREEALLKTETRFRSFVENANDIVFSISSEGLYTYVTPNWTDAFGFELSETIGKPFGLFVHPDDLDNCVHYFNLLFEQGEKQKDVECRMLKKSGEFVWYSSNGSLFTDPTTNMVSCLGIGRDISLQKSTEDALLESGANLSATLNATADGILAVNGNGKVLFANKRFFDFWNIPQTLLENSDDCVLLDTVSDQISNPDAFLKEIKRLYASNESSLDLIHLKDGRIFERYSFPLSSDKSGLSGRVWSFRDISERISIEEDMAILIQEVEARNRFVESVITNLQSGIIVVDLDFRIKMVNRYVVELCLIPHKYLVSRNLADVIPQLHNKILDGKKMDEFLADFSSTPKIIGYSCFDLPDSSGNVVGHIVNFKDLTEIVKIRKELRLKERLSSMGEVVARVAHEMRNPLFGMTAAAQILEMELSLEPNQKELMDSLLKESHRLNNLVEELLDTTREIRIKKNKLNLITVVEESLQVLEALFYEAGVSLDKNYDGEVEVFLSADSEKLEQVIINLVKNALEASVKEGTISIEVMSDENFASVLVTDRGEGIPLENLDLIFDVFYTTKKNGTGMGLSICRGIVEAHGGSLTASNNPDGGARFVMQLPLGDFTS